MTARISPRCPLIVALVLSVSSPMQVLSADEPERLECVNFWTEARYSGAGYDHWVHLQSSCEVQAVCVVITNVNPDAMAALVTPGEHVALLTWRGSPAYEFTAWVECRQAGLTAS